MERVKFSNLENISAFDFYAFYLRNSRVLSIIWFLLTICFTISVFIVFASPDWIGDTVDSPNRGYFGLFSFCTLNAVSNEYECFGTWTDFSTLPNSAAIKASCFFVGLTCLFSALTIFISILCLFIKYERIFHICAWIQFICTILLFVGLTVYPVGWNTKIIRTVCGAETDQFHLGTCALRWPYVLACISVFQIFFLTLFAFLLAARQAKFLLLYGSVNRLNNTPNIPSQLM